MFYYKYIVLLPPLALLYLVVASKGIHLRQWPSFLFLLFLFLPSAFIHFLSLCKYDKAFPLHEIKIKWYDGWTMDQQT